MPQVAILKTTQTAMYDRDGYVEGYLTTSLGESDFEEISEEALLEAKEYIKFMQGKGGYDGYVLVEKTTFKEVRPSFEQVISEIKAIKEKEEVARLKKMAAEEKRRRSLKATLMEKKKKQLEKLKRELDVQDL